MPLNGELLFDLDAAEAEAGDERLVLAGVGGGKFLIVYEPTQGQVGSMLLALAGKKGDPSGAVRNFLDDVILPVSEVQERLDEGRLGVEGTTDAEIAEAIEAGDLVDVQYIFDRMRDRERPLSQDAVVALVRAILTLRTGLPTKPSSGSTSSRPSTGSNSPAASRRVRSSPSPSGRGSSRA